MDQYRPHWYHIGGILFVGLAYVMGLWGSAFGKSRSC
jgi:hypothetical protein